MKIGKLINTAAILLMVCTLHAQTDLQNTGTLYVNGGSDILYISGSFTNASGSALTNNGNLYVLQNLINGQSSMAIGTGTLYLNGSAAQTLSGTQVFKTYNLVNNNSSGITLNNDLSVSGVHTFTAGIMTTSATPNYLMYEAGSSYTGDGDTRHVNGWVRKTGTTNFTFPVGNSSIERTIAVSSLSASSVFNALYAGATTNTGSMTAPLVTIDPYEYWMVNQVSGATAVINMNWDNSKVTLPLYSLPDIRVANYLAGSWTQEGSGATGNVSTTGNISSNTLASFGSFTFGSISLALPVNLIQFDAYNNNGNVIIDWSTSDEVNVSHYEVQRSDDGIGFYTIGNVAARNVAALQQYELTDSKELKGTTYYRLRSVDLDGKIKMSKIVSVGPGGSAGRYLTIANPARNTIHVTAQALTGHFEYRINTLAGQTIQHGSMNINASGVYDIPLSASVKMGVYILGIQKAGFSFSQKVLVE